jgi:hypothetical protein
MDMSDQFHAAAALPPVPTGPRAGLDAVQMRKISCPCKESNPDSWAVSNFTAYSKGKKITIMFIVVTTSST